MIDRDALVARLRDYAKRIDGLPSESDLAPMQVAQLIYDAIDALSRETAVTCATDEILEKARKLLEALVEPCNAPKPDADHAWRLCRRCMAIHQFDLTPDITRILIQRVLDALPASAVPPAPPRTPHPLTSEMTETIKARQAEATFGWNAGTGVAGTVAVLLTVEERDALIAALEERDQRIATLESQKPA